MSKKIFVKTLLTTSTVGLLGGGIASSLILTGCGKSKIIFRSENDINEYLLKHSSSASSQTFHYTKNQISDNFGRLVEVDKYHSYLLPAFTRQNFINGIIYSYCSGSGAVFPITYSNNTISMSTPYGGAIEHISIISYTSLDNFSYSISIPDEGFYKLRHATSAFNAVTIEGLDDDVANRRISAFYRGDESSEELLTISSYDFSNIDYEYQP